MAYRTVLPPDVGPQLRDALKPGLDAVFLTSPSMVEHLAELLGESEFRALGESTRLVCIGPSTADRLRAAGHEPAAVCAEASSAAMVSSLEALLEAGDGVS